MIAFKTIFFAKSLLAISYDANYLQQIQVYQNLTGISDSHVENIFKISSHSNLSRNRRQSEKTPRFLYKTQNELGYSEGLAMLKNI